MWLVPLSGRYDTFLSYIGRGCRAAVYAIPLALPSLLSSETEHRSQYGVCTAVYGNR